ncbi:MAG TPA: hypothetical protein VNI78_04005 [Vicinamibacterales bacterium]|nr:hypothetical protein [Vicinamibacterales bacterium]
MPPAVLIIEPRREVADALADVVAAARYNVIVRPYIESLSDLAVTPAAIVVRVAFEGISEPPHAAIARLPRRRPPVVAIAWEDCEVAEAERLNCDAVLRAPDDVPRLCEVLAALVRA